MVIFQKKMYKSRRVKVSLFRMVAKPRTKPQLFTFPFKSFRCACNRRTFCDFSLLIVVSSCSLLKAQLLRGCLKFILTFYNSCQCLPLVAYFRYPSKELAFKRARKNCAKRAFWVFFSEKEKKKEQYFDELNVFQVSNDNILLQMARFYLVQFIANRLHLCRFHLCFFRVRFYRWNTWTYTSFWQFL